MRKLKAAMLPCLCALAACGDPTPACAPPEELAEGRCVDPALRYEPAAPVDSGNVVDFGATLTALKLPPPPRSGFRIVVPPRTLAPGQELLTCVSWPFPRDLKNRVIYAGRLYTTAGLHHSNVFARPVDPAVGANPYPRCNPGASDPFKDLPQIIPDALFGNSTQVEGQETLAFPPGMGYPIDPAKEIVTNIHFLNARAEAQLVEVAYDFFTMPAEKMQQEVVPYELSNLDFRVAPGEQKTVSADCDVYGGSLVSMMVHTHRLATSTRVERLRENEPPLVIYDEGAYDIGSDIKSFPGLLELGFFDRLRFSCTFHNTLDKDVRYGLGDNEMCVVFGYMTPPDKQFVSLLEQEGKACRSFQIGPFRK